MFCGRALASGATGQHCLWRLQVSGPGHMWHLSYLSPRCRRWGDWRGSPVLGSHAVCCGSLLWKEEHHQRAASTRNPVEPGPVGQTLLSSCPELPGFGWLFFPRARTKLVGCRLGYSPGTPYPEGQPPSAVQSTHTWQSPGRRGPRLVPVTSGRFSGCL